MDKGNLLFISSSFLRNTNVMYTFTTSNTDLQNLTWILSDHNKQKCHGVRWEDFLIRYPWLLIKFNVKLYSYLKLKVTRVRKLTFSSFFPHPLLLLSLSALSITISNVRIWCHINVMLRYMTSGIGGRNNCENTASVWRWQVSAPKYSHRNLFM